MKILAAIPLEYWEGGSFWVRDLGLVVLALRAAGHDAQFVALGHEDQAMGRPVKLISRETMGDATWWQAQKAEGIILNTWSARRYDDIRTAALSAGCPLIEKMDTDGIRSPKTWFWHYLVESWSANRDSADGISRTFAGPLALLRASLLWIFPGLLDEELARLMAKTPALAVETPIAVERIKRFIRGMGETIPRVHCIPHPVDEPFRFSEEVPRGKRVIAVGRWNAHQKDFPRLLEVLDRFLALHPDWTAEVIGQLPDDPRKRSVSSSSEISARICFPGLLDHESLAIRYQSSKIFLMSSRYESFNIAAAEALCCGCSVVGPADIASIPFFTGRSSGTAACRNSTKHLLDALCAEAEDWQRSWRDPVRISGDWLNIVGAKAVAGNVIRAFQSMHADV